MIKHAVESPRMGLKFFSFPSFIVSKALPYCEYARSVEHRTICPTLRQNTVLAGDFSTCSKMPYVCLFQKLGANFRMKIAERSTACFFLCVL